MNNQSRDNEFYKNIGERVFAVYNQYGYSGVAKNTINLILIDEIVKRKVESEDKEKVLRAYLKEGRALASEISRHLKVDKNTAQNLLKKSYNMWYSAEESGKEELKKILIDSLKKSKHNVKRVLESGKITIVVDNKLLKEQLEQLFYENGIYADYSFNRDLMVIDLYHLTVIFSKGEEIKIKDFEKALMNINSEFKEIYSKFKAEKVLEKKEPKEYLEDLLKLGGKKILGKIGEDAVEKVYSLILEYFFGIN
ncbi:hypothetical protein [Marinitoga sp. 1138]|uniref:hypothetical protein n=1 Tax=Marinitoga sp. 1138 TaxID=1643334 RepID=UPI001586DAE0|nr:hypothetical protein [Marinitoga sp. 1138]NUU98456.1 hypothetical protein [Marinitoga sp. 1138]